MTYDVTFPGNKRVDVNTGEYTIKTDQSQKSGGDGTAPAPFDLFLASIASCSGIYVLSFCQSRGIPTDDIRLRMDYTYDGTKHLIDVITITVELPDDFPEHYVQPVLRAAEQCAVSRHLFNPPRIKLTASMNAMA